MSTLTAKSQSHSQKLQSGGSVKSEPSDSNLNSARKRTGENTTATSNYGSSKTRASSDVITLKDNDSNKSNSNHGVNLVRQEAGGNDDKNCSSNDIVGSSFASGEKSKDYYSSLYVRQYLFYFFCNFAFVDFIQGWG